ncbi:MAG: DNA replication and repair protein RecF [Candidatus Woykebacteria bacterium]
MIRRLIVKNLRNLENLVVEFRPGFNIIVGDNGQGKTNILEAIYLLAYGRAFRDEKAKVINWDEDESLVEGVIENFNIRIILKRGEPTKILINGKVKGGLSLIGKFVCVVFHPQEIEIVSGPPSLRRSWLDRLISTVDRNYLRALIDYQRALNNKNRLLKLSAREEELAVWDQTLAKLGSKIWIARAAAIWKINRLLRAQSVNLTEKLVFIKYRSAFEGQNPKAFVELFQKQLRSMRALERRFLVTSFGPHRDDFKVIIEQKKGTAIVQKELPSFGSRAEQRQAVLLLKISEAKIFDEVYGEAPTILLDDITSELDGKNRHLLAKIYSKQVIITTTDLGSLPEEIWKKANVMRLSNGQVHHS